MLRTNKVIHRCTSAKVCVEKGEIIDEYSPNISHCLSTTYNCGNIKQKRRQVIHSLYILQLKDRVKDNN